tara:strand:- start:685 stop:957 length:273 start_codon:yes stop_codon:yes gene_type:complete
MPKVRELYAIHHGDFVGEMWAYCGKDESNLKFLSMPDMVNRDCSLEKFEYGIENGIVEKVKRLPRYIFWTINKQFKKNEKDGVVDSREVG